MSLKKFLNWSRISKKPNYYILGNFSSNIFLFIWWSFVVHEYSFEVEFFMWICLLANGKYKLLNLSMPTIEKKPGYKIGFFTLLKNLANIYTKVCFNLSPRHDQRIRWSKSWKLCQTSRIAAFFICMILLKGNSFYFLKIFAGFDQPIEEFMSRM